MQHKVPTFLTKLCCLRQPQKMVKKLSAVKELISEIGKVGQTIITILALLVALSAIWVLGGKL